VWHILYGGIRMEGERPECPLMNELDRNLFVGPNHLMAGRERRMIYANRRRYWPVRTISHCQRMPMILPVLPLLLPMVLFTQFTIGVVAQATCHLDDHCSGRQWCDPVSGCKCFMAWGTNGKACGATAVRCWRRKEGGGTRFFPSIRSAGHSTPRM